MKESAYLDVSALHLNMLILCFLYELYNFVNGK